MSRLNTAQALVVICTFFLGSVCALAQTDAEHAQHHPQSSASKPKANALLPNSATNDAMGGMDNSMKAMQAMHEKMMAAKTPEERTALMAEHMKTMQDGMTLMGKMKGTSAMDGKPMDMGSHHQMMEKRMEMMTSMMQMMMDRMSATATQ